MTTHPRWYDSSAIAHDEIGHVAEMHLASNAVAQVSALPDESGFLIRVWEPNQTHEYGGDNGNIVSMTVRFDPSGIGTVDGLHVNQYRREPDAASGRAAVPPVDEPEGEAT